MAAVFPLDTTKPWVFNGVTYEYDASEDRWFVVSTAATDSVVEGISNNRTQIDVLDTIIDQEIENRTALLDVAASKNNQQDSQLAELDQRLDAIGDAAGTLQFKGRYQYVLEKSEEACNAIYIECLLAAAGDPVAAGQCSQVDAECNRVINDPYPDGSFTSKGATNIIADIEEFIITGKDLDGLTIDWLNVAEVGDYLEFFGQDDGDTALYEIIEEPKVFNVERSIRVKFIRETGAGDGKLNLQNIYDIRVFKTSQGLDLTEADKRYIIKPYVVYFEDSPGDITPVAENGVIRNGELWFDTSSLEMFVWSNNSWVAVSPPPTQDVTIAGVIDDVDRLLTDTAQQSQRVNSLVSDLLLENNIYYSDGPPAGDITGTLRNGDLWVDSDDLTIKFYSQGAWINPDRQVGGDYLEKSGGSVTGYVDFNKSDGKSGVRWFRGSDKYFSMWSHSQNETRGRIEKDKSFKLTGYRTGNSTEHRLVYWDPVEGLKVNKLVSPSSDDMPVTLGYNKANYMNRSDTVSTFLAKTDANSTYLKIDDYVPGGGVVGGLPTTGGIMTGTLSSKLAGDTSHYSYQILDTALKPALAVWCPGGVGSQAKVAARNGTALWFQNYNASESEVSTTAKFNYASYNLKAQNNITYEASDAHYFKGNLLFNSGAGVLKVQISPSNVDTYPLARFEAGFVVKAPGAGINGDNNFAAYPDYCWYKGRISEDNDLVNKKYVDDRIAELEARITALGG